MNILLVEDEEGLIITLTDRLRSEGFDVRSANDGKKGFEAALTGNFDLIVLDVMLPKKNGYDVCRDLRQKGVNTPILMLTAKGETIDKVLGLKLGADDYLTKPFEVIELLARVEALLKAVARPERIDPERGLSVWRHRYRFQTCRGDWGNALLELSAMEFRLLQFFIENRGTVHSRDDLLDAVWGYDAMPTTRTGRRACRLAATKA